MGEWGFSFSCAALQSPHRFDSRVCKPIIWNKTYKQLLNAVPLSDKPFSMEGYVLHSSCSPCLMVLVLAYNCLMKTKKLTDSKGMFTTFAYLLNTSFINICHSDVMFKHDYPSPGRDTSWRDFFNIHTHTHPTW